MQSQTSGQRATYNQKRSGDPNPQYFAKSTAVQIAKSTAVQMGGVLPYKWEAYCRVSLSSKLRSQESTAIQMGGVLPYKWEVYCRTFQTGCRGWGFRKRATYKSLLTRPPAQILVDVSDIFNFFSPRVGGRGSPQRGGGGERFFIENPRRGGGGFPGGGGAGRVVYGEKDIFGKGRGLNIFFFGAETSTKR